MNATKTIFLTQLSMLFLALTTDAHSQMQQGPQGQDWPPKWPDLPQAQTLTTDQLHIAVRRKLANWAMLPLSEGLSLEESMVKTCGSGFESKISIGQKQESIGFSIYAVVEIEAKNKIDQTISGATLKRCFPEMTSLEGGDISKLSLPPGGSMRLKGQLSLSKGFDY